MYNCRDSINLLVDLLDGECPPEVEKELRAHLSGCQPCEDFLDTYRKTSSLCKRAMVERMPEQLANKLTDFLRAKIGCKED